MLTNSNFDVSGLQPCNQAEADTRILLHLANAAVHGHSKTYVRTVDSDIVVLALRFFDTLGLSELWMCFGTGKKYRDIPVVHVKYVVFVNYYDTARMLVA